MQGSQLSQQIIQQLHQDLRSQQNMNKSVPGLGIIQIGTDSGKNHYLQACKTLGIQIENFHMSMEATEEEIIDQIVLLNQNSLIHGILILQPLPTNISPSIFQHIHPCKDVEGLNPTNLGNLMLGLECQIPCTAMACMKLLDHYSIELQGKNVVIVGKSRIVGLPLFMLLSNRNATVSLCHIFTQNLTQFTTNADILIVAIGRPRFINKSYVKQGAVIIDVGINLLDGKIVGDVDFEDCSQVTELITPVPKGVGPVTTSLLLSNLLDCWKSQSNSSDGVNCVLID